MITASFLATATTARLCPRFAAMNFFRQDETSESNPLWPAGGRGKDSGQLI